jgi:hypothetical protein
MNKLIAVLFCLLVTFQSCKKDKVAGPSNFLSAKKNQVLWNVKSEVNYNKVTKKLTILGVNGGANPDILVISLVLDKPGTYLLKGKEAYYYTTIGGDVISSSYQLEGNNTGELILSRFDPDTNIIEGSFNFGLKRIGNGDVSTQENLDFTNGIFKGTIKLYSN